MQSIARQLSEFNQLKPLSFKIIICLGFFSAFFINYISTTNIIFGGEVDVGMFFVLIL